MALDTYENLKASIADWLARPDLVSKTGDFITLFESNVWPLLLGVEDRVTTSVVTVAGTATVTLPSAVKRIEAVSQQGGEERSIRQTSPSVAEVQNLLSEQGTPEYFTLEGTNTARLFPTPDAEYTFTVTYVGAPAKLGPSVASNWLLETFPQLYLYGSLAHAKRYMQEADYAEVDGMFGAQLEIVRNYVNARMLDEGVMGWAKKAVP